MKKKQIGVLAGLALFCVLAAMMAAVWKTSLLPPQAGDKEITVEVIHSDGSQMDFTYETDLEYLGELLEKEGLISGTESEYGLFVDTVDGETADYAVDGGWWQLACNGEASQTGADSVVLRDGDVYTWTYTIG